MNDMSFKSETWIDTFGAIQMVCPAILFFSQVNSFIPEYTD